MLVVCRGTRLEIQGKIFEEGEECPDLPKETIAALVKSGTLVEPWKKEKPTREVESPEDEDERTDIDLK